SIPDIEINELGYPVLYLWRKLHTNSGGPGRHRGGCGLDLAWTPWYSPGGEEHVMAACWQVPPAGACGGYPAAASGFQLVNGAGADTALAQGRIPGQLSELASSPTALEGKQFGLEVGPGDVVSMRSGGGGGYGDPLTRDVALVAADVRAGIVSARAAEISYGVLLDGHGRADEAATRARREEIRARRLAWDREGDRLVRRSPAAARLIERD